MKELDFKEKDLNKLVDSLQEILGISRYLAVVLICRMSDKFSDEDVTKYGTNAEESFNQFVLDYME